MNNAVHESTDPSLERQELDQQQDEYDYYYSADEEPFDYELDPDQQEFEETNSQDFH